MFFPEYSEISLACEKRPSKSDASITWCSGAAFQHDVSLGFSQENIEGDHAVKGTLYESPYKVVTLFGLPVPWSHNWIVFEE